jgi:CubicO group peptidase (beta-lactamase class C family)
MNQSCLKLMAQISLGMILALGATAQTPRADPLLCIWSSVQRFHDGTPKELVVTSERSTWRARIDGAESAFTGSGEIRITIAEKGTFRGALDRKRDVINGFWITPVGTRPGLTNPYDPQAFASPVVLTRSGNGRWKGTVMPMEQKITLYLKIFQAPDGTMLAAFRNPEANLVGGAMQYRVSREADAVVFEAGPDRVKPTIRFVGSIVTSPERLRISWRDLGGTIELERRTPAEAAGFFPRPPSSPTYVYRKPESADDGWPTARGNDVGLDEAALAAAVQRIMDIDPSVNRGAWMIHSIAVAYKGRLVLDEYFYGHDREQPHDTRSASKMFSSLILGTLMRDGVNISPNTKVYDVMTPRGPFANPDPRKKDITLKHLMSHSAGLACDDASGTSPGDEVKVQAEKTRPDWTKATLDLPMEYEPGKHYAYCSMNINLAGVTLSQVTGEWLPALFDRQVARPLRFAPYYWNLQPNGEGYLGGGVWVRTRDFLKIGQAYLDGGVWNGHRLVSADWVKYSWTPHAHVSPATTGLAADTFRNFYFEGDDGLAWHFANVQSGDKSYPAIHTNGNGGQLLLLLPQFELAVMFTGGNYGQGLWNYERDKIVGDMIIPAIRR